MGAPTRKITCRNVLLDEYFTIRFLQPMDRESTEAALSLTSLDDKTMLLTTEWNEANTQIVVTPTLQLTLDTIFSLRLESDAKAADGGRLQQGLNWRFATVPAPYIVETRPANGSTQESYSIDFYIKFASPMRIDTVKSRIQVSPRPEKAIEWYYDQWDWSMRGFFLEPSTGYEVRLLPGMQDIYGNTIQEQKVVRFTTAAYEPSASLMMPYESPLLRADGPPGTQEFYAAYTNIKRLTLQMHSLTMQQYLGFHQRAEQRLQLSPANLHPGLAGAGGGQPTAKRESAQELPAGD